jgi:hypothetical protein
MKPFLASLRTRVIPNLIFLSICIVVFLALMQFSIQFIFALSSGFFNRWEHLPSPPATPVEILPHYSLRIRSVDQQIYGLEIFSSDREERTQWFLERESDLEDVFPVMSDCVT